MNFYKKNIICKFEQSPKFKLPINEPDLNYWSAITPTVNLGKSNVVELFISSFDDFTLNGFVSALGTCHSSVSYLHPIQVSSDMQYYIIYRDKNQLQKSIGDYESDVLYDAIEKSLPEIKKYLT